MTDQWHHSHLLLTAQPDGDSWTTDAPWIGLALSAYRACKTNCTALGGYSQARKITMQQPMPRNQVVQHLVVPTSVRGATVCSHTGIALGRVTLLQVRHRTRTSGADRTHESLTDSARTVALHRLSGLHLEFEQWVCNASLLLVGYTYLEEPPGISLDAERSTPACTHGTPTDGAKSLGCDVHGKRAYARTA